jgi:hypothetical protein
MYETQHDKAEALRHARLERRTADDDIPSPSIPVKPTRETPFSAEITPEELKDVDIAYRQ